LAAEIQIVSGQPSVPSKYDVIPIHGSDIANYKRCRRYWDWTSPARNNLRRNVSIYGMSDNAMKMWYGVGAHYALESFYDPLLKRDPVEAFKTWYRVQWEGGLIGEEWLERTPDLHPRLAEYASAHLPDGTPDFRWQVKGLKELLPNVELVEDEFAYYYDLGVGMMEFYKDYAERNDDFVVVAAESVYSIPLGFESLDVREESPNYGKLLEVHARGKRDAVIYFPDMDKFGIIDHKTAEIVGEEYFIKLEKDEQCSNYLWATMKEAAMYDLPWHGHMVDRIVYNVLRKRYPQPPTITTQDLPSINRQQEGTTAELFKDAVVGNPHREEWFRTNEKAQNYYTYLCEQGEENFIIRKPVTRNTYEIQATADHLRMIAEEMLDPNLNIYPNPTGSFQCTQCAFRAPCIAKDAGYDWKGMLADGYELNRDR
jgi:hypothetical protein